MKIRTYGLCAGDEFSTTTSSIIGGKKIKAGNYIDIDKNTGKIFLTKDNGYGIITSRDMVRYKISEVIKILFMFIFRIPKHDSVRIKIMK